MTAVGLHLFLDLLTVGNLGGAEDGIHTETALQLGHQHIQLLVAQAGQNQLSGLGVIHQSEGGIFLIQPVQAGADLFLLALDLGGDGDGVAGGGVGDLLQGDHLPGVAEGVAGSDLVHLADGADIAAGEHFDLGIALAAHGVQAAKLLGFAGTGVHQRGVGGDFAGEDLNVGILAVLVGHGLPYEGRGHAAGGDHELLGLAVGSGGLVIVALLGVGQQADDVVHQHEASETSNTGAAEHREQAQFRNALVQAVDHFGIGEVVTLEEPVHQLLVGFGDGFLQSIVELLDDGGLVVRNGDLHPLQILHLVGTLVQHIDDAGDLLGAVPDGNHHGSDLVAVLLPQGIEGGVVVGVVLVHLGDVDEPGHIPLFAVFPGLLEAYGDAVLGRAYQNRRIGCTQGLHHGAGEIEAARGIQQVNLGVLIFQRHHGGGDGNMTADLLGIVVANGVAVGVLADTVDGTGHVKQALGQGRFAAAAVAQQTDVADGVNSVHSEKNSFREGEPSIWARTPE